MMDNQETFEMDVQGAAQSDLVIICISSYEEDVMDCCSTGLLTDILSLSEEETEELKLMARCTERHLAQATPIPGPIHKEVAESEGTIKPYLLPDQTLDHFFLLC